MLLYSERSPASLRDSPITVVFVGLLYVAGNLSIGSYPLFVTSMIGGGHTNAGQIAMLAMAEFLSYGLAMLFARRFLPQRHLRRIAAACLLIQLFSAFATTRLGSAALVPCRALFGAAEGVLAWMVFGYLARAAHPARLVAIYTAALMTVAVLWFRLAPSLILPEFGHTGVIVSLVFPSLLALALLSYGPDSLAPRAERPAES